MPYNAYFILPIIFVNFVSIKLRVIALSAAEFCQFRFFCVFQGSRVTPLKCGKIYDINFKFCFKFHREYDSQKFKN